MSAAGQKGSEGTSLADYGAGLAPGVRAPAAYEAAAIPSRGRQFAEPDCPTRSPFQRDRDRVLHSTAFRRLTHKTQVFVYHEGDHYRSRLTHSLEVAQIARTIARQLRLNEDLAEGLSLAHDLGHPPYGHAGERALNDVMSEHGGFDHNAQSLRVVTRLEQKYLTFDGLNLTWEALEGLAKHNGPVADRQSPIAKVVSKLHLPEPLALSAWPSAEAQVAALSDDIAYLTHDIDDALRAGLITIDDLQAIPLVACLIEDLQVASGTEGVRHHYEVARRMITHLIRDVVGESRARLSALAPASPDDIRASGTGVIAFSDGLASQIPGLRTFLFERVYRSRRVMCVVEGAEQIVRDLFKTYLQDRKLSHLPPAWQEAARPLAARKQARLIADYLAGMTDRYALAEHRRLFDATPELR